MRKTEFVWVFCFLLFELFFVDVGVVVVVVQSGEGVE
jgi:hypothetical protein